MADLISTTKKYETAIETALGGSIQNIVTDSEETAKRLIEHLKKNRYGRATFLPLTSMERRQSFGQPGALKEMGVLGLASELVSADEKYSGLVSYLLGRVVVVDQIDHAIALAKKYRYSLRIVTLDGELLSPGGSMTGGAFKNSSNLLGRRREIEELQKGIGTGGSGTEGAGRDRAQADGSEENTGIRSGEAPADADPAEYVGTDDLPVRGETAGDCRFLAGSVFRKSGTRTARGAAGAADRRDEA